MSRHLLLLLLLAVGTLAYNNYYGPSYYFGDHKGCYGSGCKPAVKIDTCLRAECYHCEDTEVFNSETLQCECKPGLVNINGWCGICREGYQYDADLMQCIGVNPCGYNQHLVNGKCKCLPGLVVIQNICQRCPTNQTYYPQYDACRCTQGYTLINGSCINIPCTELEVYSIELQKCVCGQGYFRLTRTINGTQSTYCGTCGFMQIYNPITLACDPFVPPTCGLHEYAFADCCFCELGYVKIQGKCITCPPNSFYDFTTDSCVCEQGYFFVNQEIKRIPYSEPHTGSSFISNPSNAYSYKAPFDGIPTHTPTIVVGSNYDASGINVRGPNLGNIVSIPPINYRR